MKSFTSLANGVFSNETKFDIQTKRGRDRICWDVGAKIRDGMITLQSCNPSYNGFPVASTCEDRKSTV